MLLVLLLGTILTIILLGVVVGLVMRCSDPSRHHHHQLNRGAENGFETLQVQTLKMSLIFIRYYEP